MRLMKLSLRHRRVSWWVLLAGSALFTAFSCAPDRGALSADRSLSRRRRAASALSWTGPRRAGFRDGTIVLLHGASSNLVESMLGLGDIAREPLPGHRFRSSGPWLERTSARHCAAEPARSGARSSPRPAPARRSTSASSSVIPGGSHRPPSRARPSGCYRRHLRPVGYHLSLAGRHDLLVSPAGASPIGGFHHGTIATPIAC